MVTQQLLDYIKQQLHQGVNRDQIINSLIAKGWQLNDIIEAFRVISNDSGQPSKPIWPQYSTTTISSATALLSQAWKIYKLRFRTLLGVVILGILGLATVLFLISITGFFGIPFLFPKFTVGIGSFAALGGLFLIIFYLSQTWRDVALLYAIKDSQESIGAVESYRRAWRKLPFYLWISLLTWIITAGGYFLVIFPGIIYSVWFHLAPFILIVEDLKGMNALLKSREYIQGRFLSVFWRFIFIGFSLFLIILVPSLIVTYLKIPYGEEIIGLAALLFLSPLATIYTFLLYTNLKTLKENFSFAPTRTSKAGLIFSGVLGFLLAIALFLGFIFVFVFGLGSKGMSIHDRIREAHLRQIQKRLELYFNERGNYPASLEELIPQYLNAIPLDPKTKSKYRYQLKGNFDYSLCAKLEAKPQKCISSKD